MLSLRKVFVGICLLAIIAIVFPASSFATEITHTATVPLATTNWNETVTIPKFQLDPLCLQSVCIELRGHVEGAAKFESLDAADAEIIMNLQATLTISRPDNTPLVTVIPLANTVDSVTAFDDVIDFGGTSGKTYTDLSGNAIETGCTIDAADLVLFSGAGNILLPMGATGTSNGSGAGNLILQFATSASVEVIVTYTYDCSVPTQATTWGKIKNLYN